jgi:hypothetical protein
MITTDFETRQLLAREHRDQLARDMRLARRTRPEGSSSPAFRPFGRAYDYIRSLTRAEPSPIRLSQEVMK